MNRNLERKLENAKSDFDDVIDSLERDITEKDSRIQELEDEVEYLKGQIEELKETN